MTITESELTSRFLVMPEHMNPAGTAFGGIVVSWMDTVAAMCAEKYSGCHVATVSIDCLSFLKPVHTGDHVIVTACTVYTGTTTLEVDVTVYAEDPVARRCRLTTEALFTFVAFSSEGVKAAVPQLEIGDKNEQELYQRAKRRHTYKKEYSCRENDK